MNDITVEQEIKKIQQEYNNLSPEKQEDYYSFMVELYNYKDDMLHSKFALLIFLLATSKDIQIIVSPQISAKYNYNNHIELNNDDLTKMTREFYENCLENFKAYLT